MTRRLSIAALLLCGCLHAVRTEKEVPPAEVAEQPEAAPVKKDPEKTSGTPKAEKKAARPAADKGRPELAVSPEGLMLPGGPKMIQRALVKKGYLADAEMSGTLDDTTSGAIRKFQADQGLAKTGNPDHETVRRLGVDPEDVFKPARGGDAAQTTNVFSR